MWGRATTDAGLAAACDHASVAVTVLIVDDHAGFRSFARALLEADGFDIVGEATDGASALCRHVPRHPSSCSWTLRCPIDSFAVCDTGFINDGLGAAVVLTSSRDVSAYRRRLKRSRARGFIPKSELSGSALQALVGT